jgi:hypothetical protein
MPDTQDPGTERRLVELEHLEFDPNNPRVVELVGANPTQAQIKDLLLAGDMQARELVPSFLKNGYLPYEPMVVRPAHNGTHRVIEGNRRLAALLSMRDSEDPREREAFSERRLTSVPCVIFVGDESQELAYLGLRHLSKTKDWSASAKAAFVERVLNAGHTLTEAAQLTNTTTPNLRLLLLTRRLFERAGVLGVGLPQSQAEGDISFWHLGDAIRRTNTKNYLGLEQAEDPLGQPKLEESNFERLLGWLYGNRNAKEPRLIRTIRDIPDLDKALGNPRSVKVLEEGGSTSEALEELQAAGVTVSSHLERAKKSVQRATAGLSDVDESGKGVVVEARRDLARATQAFDRVVGFKED